MIHFVLLNDLDKALYKIGYFEDETQSIFLVKPKDTEPLSLEFQESVKNIRAILVSKNKKFDIILQDELLSEIDRKIKDNIDRIVLFDLEISLNFKNLQINNFLLKETTKLIGYMLNKKEFGKFFGMLVKGGRNVLFGASIFKKLFEHKKIENVDLIHVSTFDDIRDIDDAFWDSERNIKTMFPEVKTSIINFKDTLLNSVSERKGRYDTLAFGFPYYIKESNFISSQIDQFIEEEKNVNYILFHNILKDFSPKVYQSKDLESWLVKNSFSYQEFLDLNSLLEKKKEKKISIALVLPALNEEKTVGNVIKVFKESLFDKIPLLDKIVLIDSGSQDKTREIASSFGIPVFIHQKIREDLGSFDGKGEALWKSLFVVKEDIIVFVDTDLKNPDPAFVYGLIAPLLYYENVKYVKGYYRRPISVINEYIELGGGRVTELAARPLINLLFPFLSGFFQPLAGTYAGYREIFNNLRFFTGYGVEIAHLVDVYEKFGLNALAQVDLGELQHRSQDLQALSRMAFSVIQVFLRMLEKKQGVLFLNDFNLNLKQLFLSEKGFNINEVKIEEKEREEAIKYLEENK